MSELPEVSGSIVVGVDGSPHSHLALQWAAGWAGAVNKPLTLLAVHGPTHVPYPASIRGPYLLEVMRKKAEADSENAARWVAAHYPDLTATSHAVFGNTADVLVEVSGKAELVVIGTRGMGAIKSALLGGVADAVITHAEGTVVVVPEAKKLHASGGSVVVGVDDSGSSQKALRFACHAARTLGTSVQALHTWEQFPAWDAMTATPLVPPVDLFEIADQALESEVSQLADEFSDVRIERKVREADAVAALVEASETASLLVVGNRGRGGFKGLLLGSTSRKVLQLTQCPAAVVRK